MSQQPLYNGEGIGFLYLPQAAILHIPFALLPGPANEITWRILTIGVYALGLYRLSSLYSPVKRSRVFLLATLIALPIAFAGARNGQTTLLITGLMMLAAHSLTDSHWNRCALFLTAALAFKPSVLPFLLVLALFYRPLIGRLILGGFILAGLPYLTQTPRYVTSQYLAFGNSFQVTMDY